MKTKKQDFTLKDFILAMNAKRYKFDVEDAFLFYNSCKRVFKTVAEVLKEFNQEIIKCIRRFYSLSKERQQAALSDIDERYRVGHIVALRARKQNKNSKKPKVRFEKKYANGYLPYKNQLQDIRWKKFREFVFNVKGKKCEECGSTKYLQVHHKKYIYGKYAWEYNLNQVVVLCRECHKKEHGITE